MTVFTITDAREAGFCVDGIRDFCDKHGVSYREFIHNGVTDEQLQALGETGILEKLEEVRDGRQK